MSELTFNNLMKFFLFISFSFVVLFIPALTLGQENPYDKDDEYKIHEKNIPEDSNKLHFPSKGLQPTCPGGLKSLYKILEAKLEPAMKYAYNNEIYGRVTVRFVVEKDGSISDVKVTNGLDEELDRMVLKVIKNMPPWQPAVLNGKPVRVIQMIPIVFEESKKSKRAKNKNY